MWRKYIFYHIFKEKFHCLSSLSRNRDDATSKGHSESHEAKQSLAVYAKLYREYERICKSLENKHDPELECRKEQLMKELTARAEHIGKVHKTFSSASHIDWKSWKVN